MTYTTHTSFLAVFFLMFLFPATTHATVGGPTYIERISMNQAENSLYFLINDQSGRGCPPVIAKINISSQKREIVASCDFLEKKFNISGGLDFVSYDAYVQSIFEKTTPLEIVDLNKNAVSGEIVYLSQLVISEENISSKFQISIKQANVIKGTADFIGCKRNQPAVVTGYAIPKSDKLAILISRVGDCFEGGYTEDDLEIISGITLADQTPMQPRNNFSGPRVHEGDLVINPGTKENTPALEKNEITWTEIALPSLLTLIVGFLIGFFTKRAQH